MERRATFMVILLIFTAVVVCYGNTLTAGFIWDDQFLIGRNPIIRAPLLSFYIFKQDIANSGGTFTIYYRPLQMLSYAIDYRVWGMNPFGFHLTNVLLHFLNAVCAFFLTKKLTKRGPIALLAAVFFAIHPAHAGAVSYVSGRADLLLFLAAFLSILCFVLFRERKSPVYLAGSTVFFAAALLSKEIAMIIPVLILLTDVMLSRDPREDNLWCHIPNFFLVACYAALHHCVFGSRYGVLMDYPSFSRNIVSCLRMMKEFFGLGIIPLGSYMRRSANGAENILPFYIATGAAIIILARYLKDSRKQIAYSLMFFTTALLPLFFVMRYFQVFAEHWMYMASYGLFFFEALVLIGLYRQSGKFGRVLAVSLIITGVCAFSACTIHQNRYWREDCSLSDRILEYSENDRAALHYKAVSTFQKGQEQQALDIAARYAGSNRHDPMPWYTKGRLEFAAGNVKTALSDFQTAVGIDPSYANGYLGMAFVAFAQKNTEKGIDHLKEALRINPSHREALMLLAATYLSTEDYQKAAETAKDAKKVNPYGYNVLLNLGTAYTRLGKTQEGACQYLEAVRLYPEKTVAYYNLAYLFHESEMNTEALDYLEKALKNDPNFSPAIELLHKIRGQGIEARG
ncbi:MAG: tetratricopeptide repeat protein [Candidatus Omnitrophica bacterium]|nr:tetratricopeptide repeat protein [Candidatus Omnitrophota bacterium]